MAEGRIYKEDLKKLIFETNIILSKHFIDLPLYSNIYSPIY